MSHIVFLIILATTLFSSDISAKYKVSFGIFGEIGIAKANLHVDKQNYKITIHAKTTGFAKLVSGEREEWYESFGKADEQGILIPAVYKKTVQRYTNIDGKRVLKKDIKKYVFNHDKKGLHVEQTKIRGKSKHFEKKDGDYYAPNDLLSLFFNFKKMLPSLEVTTDSKFYAVGANKTDGRIDVKPLHVKDEFDWEDGHLMKVVINDKIFASKKGELLINLRDDGLCQEAILKDVIFFGDIRGKMID